MFQASERTRHLPTGSLFGMKTKKPRSKKAAKMAGRTVRRATRSKTRTPRAKRSAAKSKVAKRKTARKPGARLKAATKRTVTVKGVKKRAARRAKTKASSVLPESEPVAIPAVTDVGQEAAAAPEAQPKAPGREHPKAKVAPSPRPSPLRKGRGGIVGRSRANQGAGSAERPGKKLSPPEPALRIPPILLEGDQPAPPATGPGQKYALGPVPPAGPAGREAGELPEAYGTGKVWLVARDPHWLYAQWDLTPQQQRRHNALSADRHLVVRVRPGRIAGQSQVGDGRNLRADGDPAGYGFARPHAAVRDDSRPRAADPTCGADPTDGSGGPAAAPGGAGARPG